MKLLSWTIHGLGNPSDIWDLRDIVKKEDPTIVLLQEIGLSAKAMEFKKYMLGFSNFFAVYCEG